MKLLIVFVLALAMSVGISGCVTVPGETTAPATESNYPEIKDKLTWEKIKAFPVKRSDMTVDEMRQLCVDFFRFTKSALWTPDASFKYIRNNQGTVDEVNKGAIYGSLPYVGLGSGNIYRMMDYLNEETGVLDIKRAAQVPSLFGNQCSIGSYWAWGRVVNSADYEWTQDIVVSNGFIRVGPYTYDDNKDSFSADDNTVTVCQNNGTQVMYQSYALMQLADGLVQYTTSGHVMMCSAVPYVEYVEGTDMIDGDKSYLYIIDQHQGWTEGSNSSGDSYFYKKYVDRKMTFSELFDDSYLPFTFAEFQGTDPVEETECNFSFTGDTITVNQLFSGKVTANYGISDIYAVVKDASGKEVYRHAVRAKAANTLQLNMVRNSSDIDQWGTLDVSSGGFTVEVICQLSTGERPTVYTGKLIP